MYKLAIIFTFLFSFSVQAIAQQVGVLHLRPLHLELPATWSINGAGSPIEGVGPNGEKMLITVMRHSGNGDDIPSAEESALMAKSEIMSPLSKKDGLKVVVPMAAFHMPEGKSGYAVASEEKGFFGGKQYFIQYALTAPGVLNYFTFEGNGDAKEAMERFNSFMATQRWD